MNGLPALQQQFQHALLDGVTVRGLFARETIDGVNTGGFNIYANAYRSRLTGALHDNYPILHLALGDEMFDALAHAYLEWRPSGFRSIRWFGDRLAEFMTMRADLTPHPALCDLAKMDWGLRRSFDAADDDRLNASELAQVPAEAWETQRFGLRAPVVLLELHWNVEAAWQALNSDPAAETSAPEASEHTLLIWRDRLDCNWRSLADAEAAGLKTLAAGHTYAAIYEQMMAADEAITPVAAAMQLRQWVEHGLLAKTR